MPGPVVKSRYFLQRRCRAWLRTLGEQSLQLPVTAVISDDVQKTSVLPVHPNPELAERASAAADQTGRWESRASRAEAIAPTIGVQKLEVPHLAK